MFKNLFSKIKKKQPCTCQKNYRCNQFLSSDGTPMIDFHCFDCGWHDYGHVMGDSEGWEKLIICKDGIATEFMK